MIEDDDNVRGFAVQIPVNADVEIRCEGRGEAIAQAIKRFNVPVQGEGEGILRVRVDFDATQLKVNDLLEVLVELGFAPPIEMEAGMVVLDVSVPTGMAAVTKPVAAVADVKELYPVKARGMASGACSR